MEPGDLIDIWVVEKALGHGGMGSVYRCHNRSASRILAAVKVLDARLRHNPDSRARFVREAEILFQLDHPNIVKVRNVRIDDDPTYLEMEFVEGEALESILQRGPLDVGPALDVLEQALAAVAYLHAKGICHRDIKPANLLLQRDGRVKLVDFGLALEGGASRITAEGMGFGTVSYSPPEWVNPERMNPKSWDLYALGVVFWEMLTAKLAFPASGEGDPRQQAMQIMIGKQGHPPMDPGVRFPAEVRALIAEMTHADPEKRLGTVREAWERVKAIDVPGRNGVADFARQVVALDTLPGLRPSQPTPTAPRSPNPTRVVAAVGAGATVIGMGAAVVFLGLLWWQAGSAPVEPTTRSVEVVVQGIPDGQPLKVRVGAQTGIGAGLSYHFSDVAVGPVEVAWVLGDACPVLECPGAACPPWCPSGRFTRRVPPGEGTVLLRLPLDLPEPRTVRFLASGQVDQLSVGDVVGVPVEGGAQVSIRPGRYELIARAGACPPDAGDCGAAGTCPEGCSAVRRTVDVPVGTEVLEVPLGLPALPAPAPVAPVRPASRSGPVTASEFGSWIARDPRWAPGGASAPTKGYLLGWDGARPPAGDASAAVTGVSGFAAVNYCRAQGAVLPQVTASPTQPPTMEYRMDGQKLVGLDEMGSTIPIDPSAASSFFRFRCVR